MLDFNFSWESQLSLRLRVNLCNEWKLSELCQTWPTERKKDETIPDKSAVDRRVLVRRLKKGRRKEQKEMARGVFISNMSLTLKTLPLSATTPNTKKTFLDSQRYFDRLNTLGWICRHRLYLTPC